MNEQQYEWEQFCRYNRIEQQKHNNDYEYDENGNIERCSDCWSYINSHCHCPICDY